MSEQTAAEESKRRSSKYHIFYKDGTVEEDLDKAAALELIEDDYEEENIVKVIKGFAVNYAVKPKPKATLDA